MWGTDRQSNLNQADVTAYPQDDCLKQKSNKKSGNWQKVMIIPVANTNPEGYWRSKIPGFDNANENASGIPDAFSLFLLFCYS